MKRITDHYPQGITVTRELVDTFRDDRGRKVRHVKTLAVEFEARTPENLRRSWEATIGRSYLEQYMPADRYESARWVRVDPREYRELQLA